MEDFDAFARLVEALRPWLGHLVIVGGWAHRLHRFHPLANAPAYLPLRTRDADLAFAIDAPLDGDIRAALQEAGFNENVLGDHTPPVTQYSLGEDGGFYVEFLAPLQGDGLKRNGAPDVTVSKAGITAQKLRHLDVLLTSTSILKLPEVAVPVASAVEVRVANPVSFIVQKLLIHKHRNHGQKTQDVLYIHDTLELFGASLDRLHAIWVDEVRPSMAPRTAKTARIIAKELFEVVTDTIRGAARIPQDRQLTSARVRAASEYGLQEVFGEVETLAAASASSLTRRTSSLDWLTEEKIGETIRGRR